MILTNALGKNHYKGCFNLKLLLPVKKFECYIIQYLELKLIIKLLIFFRYKNRAVKNLA